MHSFPSTWKTSFVPIHKMGQPLDSPASFRSISLTSGVSKFLNASFYCFYFSFRQAGFRPGRSSLIKFCSLFQSISDELNKPQGGLSNDSRYQNFSPKLSKLCLAPRPFPQTHFGWPHSLLCSLDSNLSFLI